MGSIAEDTYPRVVWREREKKLWNPIHKKALKNLPEERVRLRVIEYLVRAGWSRQRISTEETVGQVGDTSMRTDIICYSRQFEPRLLVECKAEHVPISDKTAEQVGRYNRKVGAPFLLMTNGLTDYWYSVKADEKEIVQREQGPPFLQQEANREKPQADFEYWKHRGFAGSKANSDLRRWIENTLPDIWMPENATGSTIRFLSFGEGPSDVNLNHYYRITEVSEGRRLAVSTLNTAYGGNRLIVILNEDNENRAVMEINLDLLFDEMDGNSALYSREGVRTFDLSEYWDLTAADELSGIVEQTDRLFSEYVS